MEEVDSSPLSSLQSSARAGLRAFALTAAAALACELALPPSTRAQDAGAGAGAGALPDAAPDERSDIDAAVIEAAALDAESSPREPEALVEPATTDLGEPASAAKELLKATELAPIEVTVRATRSAAQELQHSADAVTVIETKRAQTQTVDLGEVLARTPGISVRREGGLGSYARFSLNGLYDEQVRFFLDGVPLALAGYPFNFSEVPVNLVERIEIYRGVVPIRLGADALGGAVNLVTPQDYRSRIVSSYQVGSFGTHRVTLDGRYRHEPSGFVAGASGFFDITRNDYPVDVRVPDPDGTPRAATVKRFHDKYRAYGGSMELGVVDQRWAKRLLVRGFYSAYDKDLQNNMVMTIPYGEAAYGEAIYGATARYQVDPSDDAELELVANYSHRVVDFNDETQWIYNWRGERVRERVAVDGEVDPAVAGAMDRTIWQDAVFGRAVAAWKPWAGHTLRVSLTPTMTTRTGEERILDVEAFDPLRGRKQVLTLVAGLAYELEAFAGRLSNVAFVKHYTYRVDSEEALKSGELRAADSAHDTNGAGDSLRFDFTPWLYGKASYELATRLPSPDEIFGNGVLIHENLSLAPESGHNANLGLRLELKRSAAGALVVDVNAFLRETKDLIVLLGTDSFYTYQNVYRARSTGLEQALSWTSPGQWASIDGSLTWQENRNLSSSGPFRMMQGDRMPNRPYLFGAWSGRLRIPKVFVRSGILEPFYFGRYVHSFYRGWESLGLLRYKQVIDTQLLHSIGLSWSVQGAPGKLTATFEVDNLGDAKAYDNYGVQRPGRAFYAKLRGEL